MPEKAPAAKNIQEKSQKEDPQQKDDDKLILDDKEAIIRVGGDKKVFTNLLEYFYSTYKSFIEKLKVTIENDLEKAYREVHSIKGASGNISAKLLSKAAQELETAIRDNNKENFTPLINSLDEKLKQVFNIINSFSKSLDKNTEKNNHNIQGKSQGEKLDSETVSILKNFANALEQGDPTTVEDYMDVVFDYLDGIGKRRERSKLEKQIKNFDLFEANNTFNSLNLKFK